MNLLEIFEPIRTFIFDVDGVLTDGSLLVTEQGHQLRSMSIRDGYALQHAVKKGYDIWIISGARSQGVVKRLNSLGITEVHIGIDSKCAAMADIMRRTNSSNYAQMLYMGDDIPDREPMQLCALPCCPADAVPEIRQIAKYVSPLGGGRGCVRDVIEKVLKLNNHWP